MSCTVKAKPVSKVSYPPLSHFDTWHGLCRGASPIPIIIAGGGITFARGNCFILLAQVPKGKPAILLRKVV